MTDKQALTRVQYGTLTPEDIGAIGIGAAVVMLGHMDGRTSHRPLNAHVRAVMELDGDDDSLVQVAEETINNGADYAVNTALEGGKLETVQEHHVDSGLAAVNVGFVPAGKDDPRGWPGSKYAEGIVIMPGEELVIKVFGMATSGIEGPNDKVASAAGAQAMASAWELDMLARHPGARVMAYA